MLFLDAVSLFNVQLSTDCGADRCSLTGQGDGSGVHTPEVVKTRAFVLQLSLCGVFCMSAFSPEYDDDEIDMSRNME